MRIGFLLDVGMIRLHRGQDYSGTFCFSLKVYYYLWERIAYSEIVIPRRSHGTVFNIRDRGRNLLPITSPLPKSIVVRLFSFSSDNPPVYSCFCNDCLYILQKCRRGRSALTIFNFQTFALFPVMDLRISINSEEKINTS